MDKLFFDGYFSLIDFSDTHGLLLFRKPDWDIENDRPYNTDLIFCGVTYMEIETNFESLTISRGGNEEDIRYFKEKDVGLFLKPINPNNIFIIESQGKKFYILAQDLIIEYNHLQHPKTSLGPKQN